MVRRRMGGAIWWKVGGGLAVLVILGAGAGVLRTSTFWQLEGERHYVARALKVSAREVVPVARDLPLAGLNVKDKSRGFTVTYTFAHGKVNTVAPVFQGSEHPVMEDPAQTPHDRGEAAVRAVKDYLGATAATALAQEGVDPAGLRFHQVYVEVQGDKTRLAPRYVVRFGPEGGILGMFAERSETPHPPALAGGRPARAPGR